MERRTDVFSCGRVCMLGEHSDWAGAYRTHNSNIQKGRCLVYGTNTGIHAEGVAKIEKRLVEEVTTTVDHDGEKASSSVSHRFQMKTATTELCLDAPLDPEPLRRMAAQGGHYSYVCGTVSVLLEDHRSRILPQSSDESLTVSLHNHTVTMPVQKGLSSSAAVCVLVAKAFNDLFQLDLSVDAIMDYAYRGEIATPSKCGRMDQCCAFGAGRCVSVHFDGDKISYETIQVKGRMHFVVADLGASKNTHVILSRLSEAYPQPQNDVHHGVHHFLGNLSLEFVDAAVKALEDGDAARLGQIFTECQLAFNEHLRPACPEELTAPRLQEVLNHPEVKPLVLGGKGVGSQGDGSVQFVVEDSAKQTALMDVLLRIGCKDVMPFVLGDAV